MTPNIGINDRIARLIIGVVLISLALIYKSTFMALGGLFSIYEAVSSWCVFYQILGKNTCPIKSPKPTFKWKETLIVGLRILFVAIVLNIFARLVGLSTWYEFLNKPSKVLSWDNYIFLFFVYPFILGLVGKWKGTRSPNVQTRVKYSKGR